MFAFIRNEGGNNTDWLSSETQRTDGIKSWEYLKTWDVQKCHEHPLYRHRVRWETGVGGSGSCWQGGSLRKEQWGQTSRQMCSTSYWATALKGYTWPDASWNLRQLALGAGPTSRSSSHAVQDGTCPLLLAAALRSPPPSPLAEWHPHHRPRVHSSRFTGMESAVCFQESIDHQEWTVSIHRGVCSAVTLSHTWFFFFKGNRHKLSSAEEKWYCNFKF